MTITDNCGYVKHALAVFLGLLMAQGIASAESKILPMAPAAAQFQIKKKPATPVRPAPGVIKFVPQGTTTLKVCVQGTCREGLGSWLTDAVTVAPGARALPRDFSWKTTAAGISSARWQVSTHPFTAGSANPSGLVSEGDAGSPQLGRFTLNLAKLPPLQSGSSMRMKKRAPYNIMPAHYYVRVVPMFGGKPAAISNTVRLDFPQTAPQQANPLVLLPDDVYTVSIVSFDRIKPQTLPWGCVNITGVDRNAFHGPAGDMSYKIYAKFLQSGKAMCPKTYKGIGEKPWYTSLWDFTSSGGSWVSSAYAGIKSAAVSSIAKGINVLPGNLCNAKCEAGLMAGLNAGLVALGVPPTLPTMEDLTNQGMNYLVEVAASQAGIDCDAQCQNAIRSGIQDMAKVVAHTTVASYCGDVELAHRNGAEPLCLPAGVTAEPAPGSASQPARVVVRVTRKSDALVYSALAPDRLKIDFIGTNYPGIHNFQVATNTCYTDTSIFPCDLEMLKVNGPLSAPLFDGVHPELPRMAPGKSKQYTFFLTPADYWLPGHKAQIAAKGGHVQYNDWWKLYQGSSLTVSVDVDCPRTIGAPMASCVKHPAMRQVSIPATGN
jgi:hypothetical protein